MQCELRSIFSGISSCIDYTAGVKNEIQLLPAGAVPQEISTDQIVINATRHEYFPCFEVPVVEFFAGRDSYAVLALAILHGIHSDANHNIRIQLTNPKSAIKQLVISRSLYCQREQRNESNTLSYTHYTPGTSTKYPWQHTPVTPSQLPVFRISNRDGDCEKNSSERNTVIGFGLPDAATRLATMLLDMASPQNNQLEVCLEVEGGIRGVGPLSCEAIFWLPDSFGWISIE